MTRTPRRLDSVGPSLMTSPCPLLWTGLHLPQPLPPPLLLCPLYLKHLHFHSPALDQPNHLFLLVLAPGCWEIK